ELASLALVDEPDLVPEASAITRRSDRERPAALPVRSRIGLVAQPRVDAEASEQPLHTTDDALGDHVAADHRRPVALRDITLGLEDAPEIGRNDGQRSGVQVGRDVHVDATGTQPPPLDEGTERLAVQPEP